MFVFRLALATCVLFGAFSATELDAQFELWEAERDMVVGLEEGPNGPSFSDIRDAAVGADGRIYVAERLSGQVLVLDARGRGGGVFGRKGRGPGEFDMLSGVYPTDAGVWTSDFTLRRMTLFAPSGRFVRTVPLPHVEGLPVRTARPVDGGFVGAAVPAAPQRSGAEIDQVPLVLIRGDSVQSVLGRLSVRNEVMQVQVGPAAVVTRGHPFPEHTLWDGVASGEGVVLVERRRARGRDDASLHVLRIDLQGDTIFRRAYRYTPRPLPEKMVADFTESVIAGVQRVGREVYGPGQSARIVREALDVSAALPPVTALVAGRDGSLWLRREETGESRATWHVLDGDGRPLGRLHLPADLRVLDADRESILGTIPGEYDVPLLVRYRIRGAPDG